MMPPFPLHCCRSCAVLMWPISGSSAEHGRTAVAILIRSHVVSGMQASKSSSRNLLLVSNRMKLLSVTRNCQPLSVFPTDTALHADSSVLIALGLH